MTNDDELGEAFIILGWAIIEWKIIYYYSHLVHSSWKDSLMITNNAYDAAEIAYERLAAELGEEPITTSIPGIDMSRASVKSAVEKLSQKKGKRKPVIAPKEVLFFLDQIRILSEHPQRLA